MAYEGQFLNEGELENAVGGARRLVELLDKNKDGEADAALVKEVIDQTDGQIRAWLEGGRHNLSDPQLSTSQYLRGLAQAVGAVKAWRKGGENISVPQKALDAFADAVREGEAIRTRQSGLGLDSSYVPGATPVQTVELNPDGRRPMRGAFKFFA